MQPMEATLTVVGFSHPPDRKPYQRTPTARVEWHQLDCPRVSDPPGGKCKLGLKTGCAAAPEVTA